jgi:hypothetical protein
MHRMTFREASELPQDIVPFGAFNAQIANYFVDRNANAAT